MAVIPGIPTGLFSDTPEGRHLSEVTKKAAYNAPGWIRKKAKNAAFAAMYGMTRFNDFVRLDEEHLKLRSPG